MKHTLTQTIQRIIKMIEDETKEILQWLDKIQGADYRRKVREMLDLNFDGQEEESDYKPHERA